MRVEAALYKGDNLETLRNFADGSIALTVTSPPYDNLRTYEGFSWDFEGLAKELYRVTKDGGVVVWVVGDATVKGNETGTSFRQALFFKECGFNLHDTMIYQKANTGGARGSNYAYLQSFEYMFVFAKGSVKGGALLYDRVNADGGRTGKQGGGRARNGSVEEGRVITTSEMGRRTNIWRYATTCTDKLAAAHPAIFPEQLAIDHILSWSNEGDLVLDPFMGSGTTGVACMLTKRYFVGCELSEKYLKDIAEPRIDAAPWGAA